MQHHVDQSFGRRAKKNTLLSLDSLYQVADQEGVHWLKCRIQSYAAIICFADAYNYEQAFTYAEQLGHTLKFISKEKFPEKQACYYQISSYYYNFHDWDNTLFYGRLGTEETLLTPKQQYPMLICNLMGLAYEKKLLYDSSIVYYKKALQNVLRHDPTQWIWVGILQGNIGNCLYHKKQFAEAKPMLQSCIDSSMRHNEWGILSDAYLTMGMIALDENQVVEANRYLKLSRCYCNESENYPRLEKLFPVLARLERQNGNSELQSRYLDSALVVKDSMARRLNALFILRGSQKALMLKEQQLEADKQIRTTQRNFLIVIVLLVTLVAIYIFYMQRKKFQQKRIMQENQLIDFSKALQEKNRLMEELELKLGSSPSTEVLSQLRESTILTEEEWERFRKLFDQVHKGFTVRLKEKLPDLTQAEIRFMVLAKLKFNNKEMANALNISTQAIRTTWYRLRKKLNLPEEGSLEELVNSI
jgi:hypothetical protein